MQPYALCKTAWRASAARRVGGPRRQRTERPRRRRRRARLRGPAEHSATWPPRNCAAAVAEPLACFADVSAPPASAPSRPSLDLAPLTAVIAASGQRSRRGPVPAQGRGPGGAAVPQGGRLVFRDARRQPPASSSKPRRPDAGRDCAPPSPRPIAGDAALVVEWLEAAGIRPLASGIAAVDAAEAGDRPPMPSRARAPARP